MKLLLKILLTAYIIILLWLVLLKFSFDFLSVYNLHIRSLNLIPFSDPEQNSLASHLREMFFNLLVFIPFGLILSINLKSTNFWKKLSYISVFSLAVEMIQFIFAIGRTDITDIITNTLGGFLGIKLYNLSKKQLDNEKLDRFIVTSGIILLIIFLILRIFYFKVRYR